jgi:hypothetical protein
VNSAVTHTVLPFRYALYGYEYKGENTNP